jgi:hypothetical protein
MSNHTLRLMVAFAFIFFGSSLIVDMIQPYEIPAGSQFVMMIGCLFIAAGGVLQGINYPR